MLRIGDRGAGEGGSEGADNNASEIHWTANGTSENGFSFNIGGDNVDGTTTEDGMGVSVDYWYTNDEGAPWFWGNILAQESSGNQYCPSGKSYCQASFPYASPTPDGIGISQIEGTVHTVVDGDYWNLQQKIGDGLSILDNGQTAADNHYNGLVNLHGSPTLTSSNDGDPLSDCQFAATASGNVHSWEDAEWITTYNGTGGVECSDGTYQYPPGYYLEWSSTLGYYVNKVDSPHCAAGTHGSYVGDVCNKAAY